jgi:CRP-like cAMP-binding protein
MRKPPKQSDPSQRLNIGGTHAVLGMDISSFSMLHDDDQIQAIENLIRWINEALAYHSVGEVDYRWSPAGDGGYLTFASSSACRRAIDVAFSIIEKTQHPDWRPRTGEKLRLRLALHSGTVQEARELGRKTNIWGMGINMTARALSVAASSQLLVSKQYFDLYIKGQREGEFVFGDVYCRTVKHGVHVEVMNASRHELGLQPEKAKDQRWHAIGGLWRKTIQEYKFLIHDTMKSREPIGALAAAKFLLDLDEKEAVQELCEMVGNTNQRPNAPYPVQMHPLFSLMPPNVLFRVVEIATPLLMKGGDVVCQRGDPADSCFFPVSGTVSVDVPGQDTPIRIGPGEIIGEFSLWIPNITRTATIRMMDDGLLLALPKNPFARVLSEAPLVESSVHNIIKARILENILKSRKLFPFENASANENLADVSCEKYPQEATLDLTSSVFLLFTGRVRIDPPEGGSITLQSTGGFGTEQVIGIVSDIGSPDGSKATVLEEAVAIKISQEAVWKLQKFDAVGDAWSALCGERLRAIRKSQNHPTN